MSKPLARADDNLPVWTAPRLDRLDARHRVGAADGSALDNEWMGTPIGGS